MLLDYCGGFFGVGADVGELVPQLRNPLFHLHLIPRTLLLFGPGVIQLLYCVQDLFFFFLEVIFFQENSKVIFKRYQFRLSFSVKCLEFQLFHEIFKLLLDFVDLVERGVFFEFVGDFGELVDGDGLVDGGAHSREYLLQLLGIPLYVLHSLLDVAHSPL